MKDQDIWSWDMSQATKDKTRTTKIPKSKAKKDRKNTQGQAKAITLKVEVQEETNFHLMRTPANTDLFIFKFSLYKTTLNLLLYYKLTNLVS